MTNRLRILITAGGTGGHIFPALSVATELLNQGKDIVWVGAKNGIERDIVPRYNIRLELIDISGLRNKGFLKLLQLPLILIRAFYQAFKLLRRDKPNLVMSFGGYASFPVSLVARLFGIPLIIHEQNSVAGLTNRVLSLVASRVLVAYDGVLPRRKKILVGNPVRDDFLALSNIEDRYNTRDAGLKILVLGGSLGAKVFNQNLPYVFEHLDNVDYVIHQVGRGEVEEVQRCYNELKVNAKVVKFIDDIANTYSMVDLIICRSGALTVSEICATGVASIFVPYPYAADNHQEYNISHLVESGASFMVLQKDFSIQKFTKLLATLDREKCLQMAKIARGFAILDSVDKIVAVANQVCST